MNRRTACAGLCLVWMSSCGSTDRNGASAIEVSSEILALERSALDRWTAFDPDGYLDLSAPEVTYFDPMRDKRVDGLEALRALLEPIRRFKGAITGTRYEMIDPKVQQYGDAALLTYNLTTYGSVSGGPEAVLARWNASEMYARAGGSWKLVHSHWSFTKPNLQPAAP